MGTVVDWVTVGYERRVSDSSSRRICAIYRLMGTVDGWARIVVTLIATE